MKTMRRLACFFMICVLLLCFSSCILLGTGLSLQEEELSPSLTSEEPPETSKSVKEELPEYEEKMEEIIEILDQYLVDGYDPENLDDLLAQALIASTGDRWSYYVSAEEFDAYMEDSNNAYVGIGITIQHISEDDPGFTVVSVSANSPAYEAGLQNGDMLTHVEGKRVIDLGMDGAKNLVRGEEGTSVTLTVLRDGASFDLTIIRQLIEVEVVVYELLEQGIGYIQINNFDANCAKNTLLAIESLLDQGAESLIFDLRFNPGGRKTELVEVLDYLLPEGPLFRSVDYAGNEEVDYSDADYLDLPMAVLVKEDSYSAAEFFAAALQEYEAAVIVGTPTTGKANYQQTFLLSDGSAIAISTGHYQTPNGVTLEGVGVTPDILVEIDDETYLTLYYGELEKDKDAQLLAAIDALIQ